MSKTVSIRLDDDTLKQLDMMSKAADRSRAWLMSQAVKQYVEHEAWQIDAIKKRWKNLKAEKQNLPIMKMLHTGCQAGDQKKRRSVRNADKVRRRRPI